MEPKAIRIVPQDSIAKQDVDPSAPAPAKKSVLSYEQRLEMMSNHQLRSEVRKGVKGKLSGYNSIVTSVVLDVLLESFDRGMTPFVR